MRHLNSGRSLSRSPAHRRATLGNLAQALFEHKRIRTTLAKARELRPFAEKLVTAAKRGHLAARRRVARVIRRRSVVKQLFEEIAPTYQDRPGGYTRIIKLGNRVGDNAPLAVVELVGFEGMVVAAAKAKEAKKEEAAKKTRSTSKAKKTSKEPKAERKPAEGKKREKEKPAGTTRKPKKSGDR